MFARPVLPLPGIPLIAIIRRASSAVEQNFAGGLLALDFAGVYEAQGEAWVSRRLRVLVLACVDVMRCLPQVLLTRCSTC